MFGSLAVGDAEGFERMVGQTIRTALTDDYWKFNVPQLLITSSTALSPVYQCYLAALNILDAECSCCMSVQPEWTREVMDDVDLLAFEPDPKARVGASRFIGCSASAGRVLVVIAYRDLDGDLHGVNAWPATGADLTVYEEGRDDGEND